MAFDIKYDYKEPVTWKDYPSYRMFVLGARESAYPGRTDYLIKRSGEATLVWVDQDDVKKVKSDS